MEMDSCSRTEEDVVATLTLSKLNTNDLANPSQTLFFTSAASDQNHLLIQLNTEILKSIEDGEEIVIRGNTDDSAVLCTSDKTYDIKKAKISNTLLFLPECHTVTKKDLKSMENDDEKENIENNEDTFQMIHQKIVGWTHEYLELRRIHPKIGTLKALLHENPFQGPEKEQENSDKKKYTMTQFLDIVQASEGELISALFKLGACCIDGFWRVLDFGYIVDCLGDICNVITCESWSVLRVPVDELCEKINDSGELVPDFIVRHLMSFYGRKISSDDDQTIVELDEEKICRFFAEMMLRDVGKFNLHDFLEVWQQSVPEEIVTDQKYLSGLAIIDQTAKPPNIQYFSVDSLSQNPSERFDSLFEVRPKWSREDIEPYIIDLCLEGQSVSSLLTKYARSSITDGTKLYCSRKSLR